MAETATIGIDLGTTYSVAAIVENSRPRVISDTGGGYTIPSIVAIDDKGNRLVGQAAKRQVLMNPIHTVYGAKRLIGRDIQSSVVHKIQDNVKYRVISGEHSDVLIKMRDEPYGLEEISALILDHVRNLAQDSLGREVTRAVVTVPAYFNDRQRQAVREAGKIAQMDVLRIINEPTAAALAYGFGKTLHQKLAIYDFGGGTFDVSILEVRENVFEVLATGGDTFLGGLDIDNRLAELVIHRFQKEHQIDLGKDPISHQRIRDASEQAKIELSSRPETRIHIPFITAGESGPLNIDVTIKREEFEQLCGDLVEKTLVACRQVMADAKLKPEEIDAVLLVGGSTRIPMVAKKVADFFGKPPSKGIHPDEAVALGAAIMADSLARKGNTEIQLLDVLPMTIGIQAAGGKMVPIFQRNAPYPNQKQRIFTTSKDQQASLKLTILQGDHANAAENEIIGDFTFSGIHPAPKGRAKVEVTFTLNHEGILTVSARDPDTGAAQESVLQVQSATSKPLHLDLITLKKPVEKKAGETVISATVTREVKLKAATAPPTPPEGTKVPEPTPAKPPDTSKPPLPPKPALRPLRESSLLKFFRRLAGLFKRG